MPGNPMKPIARAYVGAVLTAGAASAGSLLLSGDVRAWDWRAIALFGVLGILASALSITHQAARSSRLVHQIGSSFVYALFLLVDPSAVALVILVITGSDWAINRRRALTGAFNIAQLCIALLAASSTRELLRPGFATLDGVDPRTMAAALVSLAVFFFVNHGLTHLVVSLSSDKPLLRIDSALRIGILNEILCIIYGTGIAVLWWVRPWLSLLGIIPLWILALILILLSRRESDLERRESELRSLQILGLEMGAELDAERLRGAVVRLATEALDADGALLAVIEGDELRIVSHYGLEPAPPASVRVSRFDDGFFETGSVRTLPDFPTERDVYPELSFLRAAGVICTPLTILDRRNGLLLVAHGETRRPFDADDVRRLETLTRFVDVALSNAQLVADLKQMQEQLIQTEKMSALGMLVSGVAHELNNPLTSVLGYTQLVLSRETDPRKRAQLEKVVRESTRAARIVQNLLTFSRKHRPEKIGTDINALVEQVLELRTYEFRVHNIQLVRDLAPALPRVLVDPHQIQQVLLNLVTNAEQAIRATGRPGRIAVRTAQSGGELRIDVSDDGPGIAEEHLSRIFLPFFTTKEVGRGTGLGLSICYGIVREHGGRIEAESLPGRGATFTVHLPLRAPSFGAAAAGAEESTPETAVPVAERTAGD